MLDPGLFEALVIDAYWTLLEGDSTRYEPMESKRLSTT